MVSFLKNYWAYLLMIACGSCLAINYFLSDKTWMGFIWLTFAMVAGVRLYQQYQKDKGHR